MVASTLVMALACASPTAGNGAAENIRINIERPAVLVTVQPGMIGFNSPMGALGEPKGSYRSAAMDWALETLPVRALRFPGGTVANYFDWKTGSLIEDALERSGKQRLVDAQRAKREAGAGELAPVDFGSFYSLTEEFGVRRFVVLNLLSMKVDDTLATIDRIKSKYPGRYYWELGNELSQGAYRKRAYATERFNERVYAEVAQSIATHIAQRYPEDRVGIVVAQLIEGRVPQKRRLKNIERQREAWDTAVGAVDHADALIIHPYVVAKDSFVARIDSRVAGRSSGFEMDRATETRWRWVFASVQELPGSYSARLAERFGQRKIWITEVGLEGASDDESGRGMLRVLFNTAYFIAWLRHYPGWESFLFHGLFAGRGDMAVVGRDMVWNWNTVSYSFIRHFLEGAESVGELDIPSSPGYSGVGAYSDTEVKALSGAYASKRDGDSVILVNTGPVAVELSLPFERMTIRLVGGHHDMDLDAGRYKELPAPVERPAARREVSIPPYSVLLADEVVSSRDPDGGAAVGTD